LVFNTQFFSTLSPASGTLADFATLGVGILARPVGESWPVSAYMFAVGLVSLGAVLLLRETRGQLVEAGVTRTTS
jgi:hypothetical protein